MQPQKVTLNDQPWTVRFVTRLGRGGVEFDGDCLFESNTIRIRRSAKSVRETLLHEALHAQVGAMGERAVLANARLIHDVSAKCGTMSLDLLSRFLKGLFPWLDAEVSRQFARELKAVMALLD